MPIPGFAKGPTLPGCSAGSAPTATVPGQLAALPRDDDDIPLDLSRMAALPRDDEDDIPLDLSRLSRTRPKTRTKTARRGTAATAKRKTAAKAKRKTAAKAKRGTTAGPKPQRARTIRHRRTDAASDLADLLSASLTLGAPKSGSDSDLAALLGELKLTRT